MPSLRFDVEQKFTCAGCARCCTRPWQIVVTPKEAAIYRDKNAAQWFHDRSDPLVPIQGAPGFFSIRKRDDGACGFLSDRNRCRLHEELGERLKPLTCRMFPYAIHAAGDVDLVSASFSCPTVVANSGAALTDSQLKPLRTDWFNVYPRQAAAVLLLKGRPIDQATLKTLCANLLLMLKRTGGAGRIDLRDNVTRIANTLDDLSRATVVALEDDAFAEYISLTTSYAARSDKPPVPRRPSWTSRMMQRGFLFATVGIHARSRVTSFRLLAHIHGVGPRVGEFDLRGARGIRVDINAPDLQPLAFHYLRSALQAAGSGRRPVIEEFSVLVSSLNAACTLAAVKAGRAGRPVDRAIFTEAITEVADVSHGDHGLLKGSLGMFSGGIDALYAFADGGRRL